MGWVYGWKNVNPSIFDDYLMRKFLAVSIRLVFSAFSAFFGSNFLVDVPKANLAYFESFILLNRAASWPSLDWF